MVTQASTRRRRIEVARALPGRPPNARSLIAAF
jgi:hypothetical protein